MKLRHLGLQIAHIGILLLGTVGVLLSLSGCGDAQILLGDRDQDGWRACDFEGQELLIRCDCKDNNASIHPLDENLPKELCNGIDDDCNGDVDDGLPQQTWYSDIDGDHYGDAATAKSSCGVLSGMVLLAGDCNDAQQKINPSADEACNGLDDDCDTLVDDGIIDSQPWYRDLDGDGYGSNDSVLFTCETAPAGYVRLGNDCDDSDADRFPTNSEVCNEVDDDCDDGIDESLPTTVYFIDQDRDGYGDEETTGEGSVVLACRQPSGYSSDSSDCEDLDPTIHPGVIESCASLVDLNCDGILGKDTDGDRDGYYLCKDESGQYPSDCNDQDDRIHPGAEEICNQMDDDCDGAMDEIAEQYIYYDADSDGFGTMEFGPVENPTIQISSHCVPGWLVVSGDCKDNDPSIHPSASESCNNIDDDCNGRIDDGLEMFLWYRDHDEDGYGINLSIDSPIPGDDEPVRTSCNMPTGYTADNSDCEDSKSDIHPYALEICDNGIDYNCDGNAANYADADGDHFATCVNNEEEADLIDCNDEDSEIFPGAEEHCDTLDNNCNAIIDDVDLQTLYRDKDVDGYGFPADGTISLAACNFTGWSSSERGEDCNNSDSTVFPGAEELCDNKDNDCDNLIPSAELDSDGDGFRGCVQDGRPADCDDSIISVFPGAAEKCNDRDDDCNTLVDDNTGPTWYQDQDGDAFGNSLSTKIACTQPPGYVERAGDCLDTNLNVFPDAPEQCDELDNDCDILVDEDLEVIFTQYPDVDGDGFGDSKESSVSDCYIHDGYSILNTDCNDAKREINPTALETCDHIDNNCNGEQDEGTQKTFYKDKDHDGYGDPNDPVQDCTVTDDTSPNNLDCDDTVDFTYPGAAEVCDKRDNNCNGPVDEGVQRTYYLDEDHDGFGGPIPVFDCQAPAGARSDSSDCNDADAAVYPGAIEQCNEQDDDCNALVDDSAEQRPWYLDADNDGYGDPLASKPDCKQPAGYVLVGTDCADSDPFRYPGAPELKNNLDDNCDGVEDGDRFVICGGTPQDAVTYTRIQAAIDAADPGDIISVAPCTYYEKIDFKKKSVTVVGSLQDPSKIIIDAGGSGGGSVVTFNSDETAASRLLGVTLRGGTGSSTTCTSTSGTRYGGGICIENASPTLQKVIITSVDAQYGSALFINGGQPTLTDVTVKALGVGLTSGAMYAQGSTDATFTRLEVSGCISTSHGAALFLADAGKVTLVDSALHDNLSYGHGGALYAASNQSTLTLKNTRLYDNEARYSSASCTSGECGSGGAIYSLGSVTLSEATEVFRNHASKPGCTAGTASCTNGYAGGVYANTLDMNDAHVYQNQATGNGGGVYCNTCSLQGSEVDHNTTTAGLGGGMFVGTEASSLRDMSIHHNLAGGNGGGLYLTAMKAGVTSSGLELEQNRSEKGNGGGLYLRYGGTCDSLRVAHNRGYLRGGGIYLEGGNGATAQLTHAWLIGNQGSSGGGLAQNNGTLILKNSLIQGNTATVFGGGLYLINNTSSRTLTNLTIEGNFAGVGGGGINIEGGTAPLLENSILAFNQSGDATLGGNFRASAVTSPTWRYNLFYMPAGDGVGAVGTSTDVGLLDAMGNIRGEDPLFQNDPRWRGVMDDNVHLQPGSPAINKGNGISSHSDPCFHYSDALSSNHPSDLETGGRCTGPTSDPSDRNDMGVFGGPASAATDNDLDFLPDDWESQHHLNLQADDGVSDYDDDELTDQEEYALGTNPRLADSDGDGLSDLEEANDGDSATDPASWFLPGGHGDEPNVGYVGAGRDFETLLEALLAAAPGAIIRVEPGTWNEAPRFLGLGEITVESLGSSADTILDGADSPLLQLVETQAPVTLRGFTLRAGQGMGGCIAAVSASVTLEDVVFTGCRFPSSDLDGQKLWYGGAIYARTDASDTRLTLQEVTISGSTARSGGGAIYALAEDGDALSLTLEDSVLSNNTCNDSSSGGSGGAISITGTGSASLNVSLARTTLSGNLARSSSGYGGGALYLVPSSTGDTTLEITDSTVSGNSAQWGGAIHLRSGSSGTTAVIFRKSVLESNVASADKGGALYLEGSAGSLHLTIAESTLAKNTAGFGGAFYVYSSGTDDATVDISESEFRSNASYDDGGALNLDGALTHPIRTSLRQSTFSGNAGATGPYANGGALYGENLFLTADQTLFEANTATDGGALYVISSTVALTDCLLVLNKARAGSALEFGDAQVDILRSRFGQNSSTGGAGAILSYGQTYDQRFDGTERLTLDHVLMDGNTSGSYDSPAVDIAGVPTSIRHSTFVGNAAPSTTNMAFTIDVNNVPFSITDSIVALNSDEGNVGTSSSTMTESNNLFYSQVDGKARVSGFTPGASDLIVDPRFLDDWRDNQTTDDDYHLNASSAARDVGSLSDGLDPDDTLPDIGIYGGPDAELLDFDLDGFPAWFWPGAITDAPPGFDPADYDCDDLDESIGACALP